jgi:hypothetical protein
MRRFIGNCLGVCVGVAIALGLMGIFMASQLDGLDDEPSREPSSTMNTSSASPHPPEEDVDAGADGDGGTDSQGFDGQVGIQFGYACSPVGALGIAEDGRPAKCFMGKDGRARWGYDSNRG